ncbi:MAG: hypothetical protein FWF33_00785 [Clostridiales bacterium]|nr:hypothetical protein [Clostridiales bacterium]
MKVRHMKVSKSAVFLFELMIVIAIFTAAAAICMQIFAASFRQSEQSRALTMSAVNAQTVAERFKADAAAEQAPLWFDRDWKQVKTEADAYYTVTLVPQISGGSGTAANQPVPTDADGSAGSGGIVSAATPEGLKSAQVQVLQKGEKTPLFTLDVKEYVG